MSKSLYQMYRDCVAGNYTRIEELRKRFPNTQLPSTQANGPNDDSDSDSSPESSQVIQECETMEVDQDPPRSKSPEPDENGFILVRKGGKSHR
jgi:hypothetical protein